MADKFKEGYVRGGRHTVYLDRSLAIDVVAYLLKQGALREISREARFLLDDIRIQQEEERRTR